MNTDERWWARATPAGDADCWIWNGARNSDGYGHLKVRGKQVKAHRYGYELLVGPIPVGLMLDHLCRNRTCVNPSHLEPVTSRENTLRGETNAARQIAQSTCIWGHPLAGLNLRVDHRGKRVCRECNAMRSACYRVAHGQASERDRALAALAPWTFDLTESMYKTLAAAG